MKPLRALVLALVLVLCAAGATAQERIPPPEFESGHVLPVATQPGARAGVFAWIDVGVLVATLALASHLALRRRRRREMAWLAVFSLVYFGFYREGCVCPVGATQNVVLAISDPSYALPASVLAFFFLPLVTTLFFGRSFCAAVCPLGTIQDVVLLRPTRVPEWLDSALRLGAYLYLGLAVLLAALGAAFVICRYDPFVSFFRLSGGLRMLLLGGFLLLLAVFVGRPYCRWLCPYGVLLGLASRVSRWRVAITPTPCVQCRLCEDSCPYHAIVLPTPARPEPVRAAARRRLALLLALAPLLVGAGLWLGRGLGTPLSRLHPTVVLAERVHAEDTGKASSRSDESRAFRRTGKPASELFAQAASLRGGFVAGGGWLGAWMGLVLAVQLAWLSLLPRRTDYEADRGSCLACARCFEYCPNEYERRRAAFAV